MTEVTESTPEESGQKLRNSKKEQPTHADQARPDNNAKGHAPASGQAEQRDTTIGRKTPSAADDETQG